MDFNQLIKSCEQAHKYLQSTAVSAVNQSLTIRNWLFGHYIVEYEQNGEDRATYGTELLKKLAEKLNIKGLSDRSLRNCRQFYLVYPQITTALSDLSLPVSIWQTASAKSMKELKSSSIKGVDPKLLLSKLSISHIIELAREEDPLKRSFYESQAIQGNWSLKELQRQVGSLLYERIGLSTDKKGLILDNHQDIHIQERYIHQLHGILLKYSEKDQAHKGNYKNLSNQVVANYPDSTQRTIFRSTEPHLTPGEMQQLITWQNDRQLQQDLHPLMITATFVYEFLSIHPYQDGNGRLSRLLTTLLLMKQEYGFIRYVSFENVVEAKKEAYYRALMDGQKNRYKETERIDRWILFFMECLIELTRRLKVKYETYNKLTTVLNDRQQAVMAYFREKKTAQVGEIDQQLKNYSRNTLKKDLAMLVEEGLLLKTGAGRGVRYHIVE